VTSTPAETRPLLLLADDDDDILGLVRVRLERAGYDVLCARHGEEALALIHEKRPDLALLDVRMPKLDGCEVTQRVRAAEEVGDMPVVLLSAGVRGESVARGLAAGATAYLGKPFDTRQMLATVEAALRDAGLKPAFR
jgi:DNA-binding response OmpR family regulator